MNFKDKIMRKREQSSNGPQYLERKQKENDTDNWFAYYQSNCRNSQRREPGEFQRNMTQPEIVIKEERSHSRNQVIKKPRNTEQRSSQHYEAEKNSNLYDQRNSQHFQGISMKNSKQPTEQLIHSKIKETKGEISQQLSLMDHKFQSTLEDDRELVTQYMEKQNQQIQKVNAKVKEAMSNIVMEVNKAFPKQTQQIYQGTRKMMSHLKEQLRNEMNQSLYDLEEKIERIAVSGDGGKKKTTGDYSVELKSSINDIGISNNHIEASADEVKFKQIQETIKALKLEIIELKTYSASQQVKSVPTSESFYQNKSQMQKEMSFMNERLKRIENEIIENRTHSDGKFSEFQKVAHIQEDNLKGMNDEFSKVINTQMIPRLKQMQEQFKQYNSKLDIKIQQNYNQKINEKISAMTILKIRKPSQKEKNGLEIKQGITYKQTYMVDEEGYILDSSGVYIVDEFNKKIKIEEQQMYLLKAYGIQIDS